MKIERAILVAFLGNYLVNTVIAALVYLIPTSGATGMLTPQYIAFVIASAILVAVLAWWYKARGWKDGLAFGVIGLVVAILTAFITGIAGVLAQTGSFSSVAGVLPNFWPFLWNWSTLVLAGYWIIPALLFGWWAGRGMMAPRSTMGTM
jgi:hypothetical protein